MRMAETIALISSLNTFLINIEKNWLMLCCEVISFAKDNIFSVRLDENANNKWDELIELYEEIDVFHRCLDFRSVTNDIIV